MPVDSTLADPTAEPNTWKATVLDPWVADVSGTFATLEAEGGGGATRVVTGATGTNATTDMGLINTAVAAVHAAGGGYVDLVSEDTYLISTASAYGAALSLAGITDVTIRGNGATIKHAAGTATGTIAILLGGTRNKIENVVFDHNNITDATAIAPNSYAGPGWITGCRNINGGLSLVRPTGATADLVIAYNYAFDCGIGIYFDNYAGLDRIKVLYNWVNGNGDAGDGIEFNCVDVVSHTNHYGARDIMIVGNTVWNYATSGNYGLGVSLANVTRFIVAQNHVYEMDLDAYHIEDGSNQGVVFGNHANSIGRAGFSLQNGFNEIGNCHDVIIEGNHATATNLLTGDACYEVGGSAAQKEIIFRGNYAKGIGRSGATCYAYHLWQTGGAIIANAAWNTIGATTAGFRVFDPTDTIVAQNRAGDDQATKTQDHGLIMAGTATRVRRRDNNWTGNGTASTSGTWAGESYTASDDFT